MSEESISARDFAELKQQVGELHGSLYRNGFRKDIAELKEATLQNVGLIKQQSEYFQLLNHRMDLFEANREHTCPVAERLLIQTQKKKETAREFWQDLFTKFRFWLLVVGFLVGSNIGDIIRTIKSVIN